MDQHSDPFDVEFSFLAERVHSTATRKGWWDSDREDGTLLMLMVSEIAEAMEGVRHHNPPSEHIPEFSAVEEELADVVIRVMDYAAAKKLRVARAILAKVKFNETRKHRHGGKVR